VNEILDDIEKTQPNLRAELVKRYADEMVTLENTVLKKDQEMKQVDAKVRLAMHNEIQPKDLSSKLFRKYITYIQKEVEIAMNERASLVPLSTQRRKGLIIEEPIVQVTPPVEQRKDTAPRESLNSSMLSTSVQQHSMADAASAASNKRSGSQIDNSSVQSRYRSAGQNTLYYLVPDSNTIHLLDFTQRKFIKKRLQQRLPMRATSTQTLNGNIYVIGGMLPDQNYQQHAQKDCLLINYDLEMVSKARM